MKTRQFSGKVRIKGVGHPLDITIKATSLQAARAAAKSMYGKSFKSFFKQMASR